MTFFKKADNILEKVMNICAIVPFIGMVVLVFCQVWTRFLTDSSLTWSEELSRYLMCYMVFAAAVLVARDKSHIRIENLTSKLHGIPMKAVAVISNLIQVGFLALVVYGYFVFLPISTTRISATNHIPMSIVYFCVPVSCFFMAIYYLRDMVVCLMMKDIVDEEDKQ